MDSRLKGVEAVGFDLDGTLYPQTPEINDRVRTEISKRLLEKRPELRDVQEARGFFEERYIFLGSGTKILEEAGFENPSKIMDDCLARADIADLIQKNPQLVSVLNNLHSRYFTYLLTSSPMQQAYQKLSAIGINPEAFNLRVFSDTLGAGSKQNMTAFEYVLDRVAIPQSHHVYAGDSVKSDIIPARTLGMKTISVGREIPEATISIKCINELGDLLL